MADNKKTAPRISNGAKGGVAAAAAALAVVCLTQWEGMDLIAKHFAIDPPGVITACIGRTNYDDPDLRAGQKFTPEQCKQFLLDDLPKYAAQLDRCLKVETPPHRRAALISFTYNVGGGTVCKSSVIRYINQGDVQRGCDALMNYTKANGKYLQGLANRRKFEREWCLRED
jgi:lysozyme